MKKQHSVLEVLFPQVRAEVLRLLFAPPRKQRYVRELMQMSGLALSTIQQELRRLSALQLISSWSNRYHRFYRANRDHPLFRDLVHIVETSEKTPLLGRSAVHRQRKSRRRGRKQALPFAPDPATHWDLFSRRRKT